MSKEIHGFKLVSLADFDLSPEGLIKAHQAKIEKGWGPWKYIPIDSEQGVLECRDQRDGSWLYEVDLERVTTSASALDWIVQVSKKTWADPALVGHLVRALDTMLDLQGTRCSFGIERYKRTE